MAEDPEARSARIYGAPVHVAGVEVTGLYRTSASLLDGEVYRAGIHDAHSFQELAHAAGRLQGSLQQLGIFRGADIQLTQAPEGGNAVLVTIAVEEPERPFSVSADMQMSSTSAEAVLTTEAQLHNALGFAERFSVSVSQGNDATRQVRAGVDLARVQDLVEVQAEVFDRATNHTQYSSFTEQASGVSVSVAPADGGPHRLAVTAVLRDTVADRSKPASRSILEQSLIGTSCKTSLSHTYTRNTLDSVSVPTQGYAVSVVTEVAAPLPVADVSFVKSVVSGRYHWPLARSVSLGTSFKAGLLRPLHFPGVRVAGTVLGRTSDLHHRSKIPDRFFHGGPLTMRGFHTNALGPRDAADALGGDLLLAAGASLAYTLPHPVLEDLGVQGQVFCNAASVSSLSPHLGLGKQVLDSVSALRTSVGVGLVVPLAGARLEINYCIPVHRCTGDTTSSFQWGIGLEYL